MADRKRDENGRFLPQDAQTEPEAKADKPKAAPVTIRRRIRGRIITVVQHGKA